MGLGESVHILEKIGSGSYGEVYKAKWKGRIVAAKRLHPVLVRYNPGKESAATPKLVEGIQVIRELRHQNIVDTIDVINEEGKSPILLTELLDCSLATLVERSETDPKVSTTDVISIMLGVARGLEYLHNQKAPIVHGDIAPKNILLDSKKQAKLADISLTKIAADYRTFISDTHAYRAPETHSVKIGKATENGTATDIFSFGVNMLQVIVGHPPCTVLNPLIQDPASVACLRHHKDFGEMEGDHPLRGLVMSCLEYDPTLRPTASDIVQQLKSQELETVVAKFELRRSINKLEEEFLEWIPVRRFTIREIEELDLDKMAAELDEHHRNINIATAAAASTSLVATGMVVGGFIASFFTAGAALPVAITGGVIGAAGGLTTFGSKMVDIVLSKIANGKVADALEDDKAASTRLRTRLDELDRLIVQNVQIALNNNNAEDQEEPQEHKKEEILRLFEDLTGFSVLDIEQLHPLSGGTRGLGAVLGVAASSTTAGLQAMRVGTAAFDTLTVAARATHVAGFVLSIISLPFDIYFLARSSKELKDHSPSEVAKAIRNIPARMNCPEERLIPELVRDYVRHKASEALQGFIEDDDDADVAFVNAELQVDGDTFE